MTDERAQATIAEHLTPYLPVGALEAECTIPVAQLDAWLADAGLPPLPLAAREPAWWAGLAAQHPLRGLAEAAWRAERVDWDGAGITFVWRG